MACDVLMVVLSCILEKRLPNDTGPDLRFA